MTNKTTKAIRNSLEQAFGDAYITRIRNNYLCQIPGHYTVSLNLYKERIILPFIEGWYNKFGINISVSDDLSFNDDKVIFTSKLELTDKKNPKDYIFKTLGKRIKEGLPNLPNY